MKKGKRFKAVMLSKLFLLLTVFAGRAYAETSMEDLKSRIEALEKQADVQKPLLSLLAGQKLGLLLQLQATHDETAGANDAFKGRRAEISIGGSLLPERISYRLQIDPFLTGNITKDAYVRLTYVRFADFQFGQYKYPQGLEGRWSSGDLDFAERAVVSSTFGDKRDYAAQIGGSQIPLGALRIEYALAAVNGAGQNTPENNDDKDFAGRAGFQVGSLWLGSSGYLGHEPSGRRERFGTEIRVAQAGWKVQGEYLYGKTEPAALGLTGASVPQEGYYVLANYRHKSIRPGIRWQSFDSNKNISNRRVDALTGGIDLFLTEGNNNKITLNYTARWEEGTAVPNNDGVVQFQVAF